VEALMVLARYTVAVEDPGDASAPLKPALAGGAAWLPPSLPVRPRLGAVPAPARLGAAGSPAAQAFAARLYRFLARALQQWPEQRSLRPIVSLWRAPPGPDARPHTCRHRGALPRSLPLPAPWWPPPPARAHDTRLCLQRISDAAPQAGRPRRADRTVRPASRCAYLAPWWPPPAAGAGDAGATGWAAAPSAGAGGGDRLTRELQHVTGLVHQALGDGHAGFRRAPAAPEGHGAWGACQVPKTAHAFRRPTAMAQRDSCQDSGTVL